MILSQSLSENERMAVQLNHTIAWCRDQKKSAEFLAHVLGLPEPRRFMHFLIVDLSNDVSIDYFETDEHVALQHFAFLVSDDEFDAAYGRIQTLKLETWADPARTKPGEINNHDGGRGVYFEDPDGHFLELITRPYGSGNPLLPEELAKEERFESFIAEAFASGEPVPYTKEDIDMIRAETRKRN